jgi:cell division protein FtsQ
VATKRTGAPARAAVLPFPGGRAGQAARRLLPTRRSLLVGLGLLLAAAALYVGARESSVFAIRSVRVVGAPPGIAREVRDAAQQEQGKSLLQLDGGALLKRIRALPDVASARYDRAFPHTLKLIVTPERPVAVLRRGADAWVVSMRGRVIRSVPPHSRKALPRIWLPAAAHPVPGGFVHGHLTGRALAALVPLVRDPLPVKIANVTTDDGQLTLVTASHIEIVLGTPTDVALKLALVRRLLPTVSPASSGIAYVDVSVPEWVVTGVRTLNPPVKVKTSSSDNAGIAH